MRRLLGILIIAPAIIFFISGCGKIGKKKKVPGPDDKVYSVSVVQTSDRDIPDVIDITGKFMPIQRLEVKSDFTGKVQALSVVEGQDILSGDALLKIEDEKLPWVLERQRAQLREAEAQMELDGQGNGALTREDALDEEEEEPFEEAEEEVEEGEEEVTEEDEDVDEEDLDPQERLARLRARALRARRQAQRRQSAQRNQEEERSPEQDNGTAENRYALNQAKVDRIRAELSLTERQIQGSTLSSPIDGFVGKVEVSEGSLVQPMDLLLEIITVNPIDLSLQVPKEDIGKISKTTTVKVIVPDLQGQSFQGEISFIGAELEANQKTTEVRVRVNNPEIKIKSGMEGAALLGVSEATHKALMVPSNSVINLDGKHYVYVVEGQVAERKEVTTGSPFEGWVEIKKGLKKSDQVVSQGIDQLGGSEEFVKPR